MVKKPSRGRNNGHILTSDFDGGFGLLSFLSSCRASLGLQKSQVKGLPVEKKPVAVPQTLV
jgi:hypothetical protein